MADFSLFEEALNEYEISKKLSIEEIEEEVEIKCEHINFSNDGPIVFCVDCGEEIDKNIYQTKEWRYYGQTDNKRTSDPNRVIPRKIEDKNIYKDVENMGFSDKVIHVANQIYIEVTKGQIFRGNSRRAIVFASIFHAFKLQGNPQSHDDLMKIFNIDRHLGLKGIKQVSLNTSKKSPIHVTQITPENLIGDVMDKFKATREQKDEVVDIYSRIKNKSSIINRSRPQSVACALTYFWICHTGKDINLKEFAKKVGLSELTIQKRAKDIADILEVKISTI